MNAVMLVHISAGFIALVSGAMAIAARKGGPEHASAGTWFVVSMLVLGVTASALAPFKSPPDSPIGGLFVCYFVATSWMTARRRDGKPGMFEKVACLLVLVCAAATVREGFLVLSSSTPQVPGPGALFAFAGICFFAGMGDLIFVLRGKLSARQRLSRHLWRMCFALFIATGSFFIGQQDIMPASVRGSPILFVLGFAPFAVMAFWLTRLRFAKAVGNLSLRTTLSRGAIVTAPAAAPLGTEI